MNTFATILGWVVTIPLAFFALWVIAFHWWVIWLHLMKRRERVPSMVPLAGGLVGLCAVVTCPIQGTNHFFWVPVAADPGCWYLIVGILIIARRSLRKRLSRNDTRLR